MRIETRHSLSQAFGTLLPSNHPVTRFPDPMTTMTATTAMTAISQPLNALTR
jgi:hypothetical protein